MTLYYWEDDMANKAQTVFHYSRKKLGLYLLLNICMLVLATLFTISIFPDYPQVYYFALGSCIISLLSALFVFIVPLPLAIVTPHSLKIDRAQPILWQQISSVTKKTVGRGIFSKKILKIHTIPLTKYRYTFMQRIASCSEFGAFSIPLYAMNKKDAKAIEQILREQLKTKVKKKLN